jgi:hypothetical protein
VFLFKAFAGQCTNESSLMNQNETKPDENQLSLAGPASDHLPLTHRTPPPLPQRQVSFIDVFRVDGPFLELALILTRMCLTHNDPLLAALLLVCTKTWGMRKVVHCAIRRTMCSLLRTDDAIISGIVNGLDDAACIRLFKMYRSVHSRNIKPVIGDFIAAGSSRTTAARFIPTGFRKEYIDEEVDRDAQISDSERISRERARNLLKMINTCLFHNGTLNRLVSCGIFSHKDSRIDALEVIGHMQKHDVSGTYHCSNRCSSLVSLLQRSFAINDISNVLVPTESGGYALQGANLPRLSGIQLTFDSEDLEELNAQFSAMKSVEREENTLSIYYNEF